MEIEVRRANSNDMVDIIRLLSELGYTRTAEQVEAAVASGTWLFLASVSGRVVGLLALVARQPVHQPKPVASIDALVVQDDYRSKGVGHALMQAAVHAAHRTGAGLLELHSNLRRVDAHRFYEHEGFQATSKYFVRPLP